jgi:negative modulator of initiation of replication
MKNIEIDDELYLHIVANTQSIGEDASSILRRLLDFDEESDKVVSLNERATESQSKTSLTENAAVEQDTIAEPVEIDDEEHGSETVFNFINIEELAMQRGAVGRFLLILAALYRAHPKKFNVVTNIGPKVSARKTKRLYFALSEALLTASGSSTKPKQIPQSPYWVITNSNTTRKKMMLTEAATLLGYNEGDVIKIRELL